MAVYVDDMHATELGRFGRMKMSHMIADTTDEPLAMADRIGVRRCWLQFRGSHKEHFDIALSKRDAAVAAGAVEVGMKTASATVGLRRLGLPMGAPETAIARYLCAKGAAASPQTVCQSVPDGHAS